MSRDEVLITAQGSVLTLTINRPEQRNALNPAVVAGLSEGLTRAASSTDVRAVVITGAGDRAFCAGADLQSGTSFRFDYAQPRAPFADLLRQARGVPVPIVGRVNGACLAGGMGLLAVCDLAVAAGHARFGLPEVSVGVFPMQVLAALQRLLPRRRLAELCLTGEPVSAEEALALGLVNRVVPAAELDAAVQTVLAKVLDKSPTAIRRGKYAMTAIETMSFEEAMAFMEGQIGLLALTEDAREGLAAFKDKRPPSWTGR